jgi:two-component system, NtrC family, response regulator AtoC
MRDDLTQSYRIDPAELPDESVIFGCTAAMGEVRNRIFRALDSEHPVLIQGESGTGKEVIARFLHSHSGRREAPFVKLNCAAVPASLLESELFGYQKGSFTGAKEDRRGLIEIADGGALFLDEIGELHRDLQAKLLHLLEDGSFTRIGDREERIANVRIICATNVDLRHAVDSSLFREDLFYRIEVVSLRLPSLRDRKEDIPQLCEHFLEKLAWKFGRSAPLLNPGDAVELAGQSARTGELGSSSHHSRRCRRPGHGATAPAWYGTSGGKPAAAERQPKRGLATGNCGCE